MKPKLLISGCLCGNNTKYNGLNNKIEEIDKIKELFELYVICPEVMGGLSVPRLPSEISGDFVYMSNKQDVTKNFKNGAQIALNTAIKHNIQIALLKDGSPSCGLHQIYDGTFTGSKIEGMGITTRLLIQNNIKVYTEKEIDLLIKENIKNEHI